MGGFVVPSHHQAPSPWEAALNWLARGHPPGWLESTLGDWLKARSLRCLAVGLGWELSL